MTPFNKEQQIDYIKKYCKFSSDNLEYINPFKLFGKPEDYIQVLNENSSLDIYCNNPFMLFLIILAMPGLNKKI